MATFSATAQASGYIQLVSSGVAGSQCNIWNTTQGNRLIYSGAYNSSSLSVPDTACSIGVNNSYTITYYSSTNAVLGSLSASATAQITTAGSISVSSAGSGYVTISWSYPSFSNSTLGQNSTNIWINGVATNYAWPQSSVTVFVGYSNTSTYQATFYFNNTMGGMYTAQSAPSTSFTTPAAPPPAPAPASNLVVTSDDYTNNVGLSWTGSGASGYYIYRTQPGGSMTYITSVGGTTYTDTASGAGRPVLYQVLAYNTNSGGTTTAGSYASVYTLAHVNSSIQPLWNVNIMATQTKNVQWIDFNARLTPNAILVASGVSGVLSDVQDDPSNPDANSLVGSGPVDVRLAFTDPGQISMSNPVNTQKFRIVVTAP